MLLPMQSRLNDELLTRQARPAPLCPIREELFSQTFDELHRQIILECPERGVLLLRVRDELRMTMAAYNTIATFQMSRSYPEPDHSELERVCASASSLRR
jgi:hypothetical protein